jgi:hypothetical protein
MLAKPTNVRFFGAIPADQELSRGEKDLRITFDVVPGADSYAVRLNGTVVPGDFQQGGTVTVGSSNTLATIEVRAQKVGQTPSDWSDTFKTVTRPPTPSAPRQLPYELSEFAIVVGWAVASGFPGDNQSSASLIRDGMILAVQRKLVAYYADATYKQGLPHVYTITIVIPQAAVPDDVLSGPNQSFTSMGLTALAPPRLMSVRRTNEFMSRIRDVEVTILRRLIAR